MSYWKLSKKIVKFDLEKRKYQASNLNQSHQIRVRRLGYLNNVKVAIFYAIIR
jgi:hypothetical protein